MLLYTCFQNRMNQNELKRERLKRLRDLAAELTVDEYWVAMNRIIREPNQAVENSSTLNNHNSLQ